MSFLHKLKSLLPTRARPSTTQTGASQQSNLLQQPGTQNASMTDLFAQILLKAGHKHQREGHELMLECGIGVQFLLLQSQALNTNEVKIIARVVARHPILFPQGWAEYVHALGRDENDALSHGIRMWTQLDLVTLEDLLRRQPRACHVLKLDFPDAAGGFFVREVLFGPVAQFARQPKAVDAPVEEHPFCPCCLFNNSRQAFSSLLQDGELYAIRLFAVRNEDGSEHADCRVNGEDFAAGAKALESYIHQWPQRGLEFRKQLVLIRNVPRPS